MPNFTPPNPDFENYLRQRFTLQKAMQTIGATLGEVYPGEVHIDLPFHEKLTQQDGFLHAGIVTTIVDSACGYAAFTLMPVGSRVLSVEFKVNLMSPAVGDHFVAIGKVIKPGRTITVCSGEVFAYQGEESKLVALMQATMIRIEKE
jgi:uncharacterized protein (TIGR00369 family)